MDIHDPPPPYEPEARPTSEVAAGRDSLEAREAAVLGPLRVRLRLPARNPPPNAGSAAATTDSTDVTMAVTPAVVEDIGTQNLDMATRVKATKSSKRKAKRKATVSDEDFQGDSEPDISAAKAKKTRREAVKAVQEEPPVPETTVAECVIQVEQAPIRVGAGKGGQKMIKQDPLRFGPIEVTEETEWVNFLDILALACNTTRDCLNLPSLVWRLSKPGNSPMMPLGTEVAYISLRKKIKDKLPTIIVSMKPPRAPDMVKPPWAVPSSSAGDTSPWTSLIQDPPGLAAGGDDSGNKKGKLDDVLEDLTAQLEERYPVGLCEAHPNKRCFHHKPADLHFELNRPRLLVWASQIEQKKTTIERAPLNSNLFKAKDAMQTRAQKERAAVGSSSPGPDISDASRSSPMRHSGTSQYNGPMWNPMGFPLPNGQWNWLPPQFYGGPTGFPMQPGSAYTSHGLGSHGDHGAPSHAHGNHTGASYGSSPPPEGPLEEYYEWCGHNTHTRDRLEQMGFEVGSSLSSVPETEWKAVGFKYLEWQNVLDKDRRYRRHVKGIL